MALVVGLVRVYLVAWVHARDFADPFSQMEIFTLHLRLGFLLFLSVSDMFVALLRILLRYLYKRGFTWRVREVVGFSYRALYRLG